MYLFMICVYMCVPSVCAHMCVHVYPGLEAVVWTLVVVPLRFYVDHNRVGRTLNDPSYRPEYPCLWPQERLEPARNSDCSPLDHFVGM